MSAGCPNHEELSAFVLGKLPEETLDQLSHHAAGCPKCQSTLQALDTLSDPLLSQVRQPRRQAPAPDPALRRFLQHAETLAMQPGKSQSATSGPELIPVQQFIQSLSDSDLFTASDVHALIAGLKSEHKQDTRQFAQELIRLQKLTRYQAAMLAQGKPKGLVLGNYVILDKLGQGGMGMVLKAQHRRMKRVVALKVLSPAITKNPTAVQRFQREVEAAAKLSHANIVAAHDADEAKGTHFLVMEYVEGSDLSVLVKKHGPLTPGQAVAAVVQAAKGLEQAHAVKIVHRDIKPSNLLLDKSGLVKVLGLGLARIDSGETAGQAELTQTGSIMGTCDYMAPEQALNTKLADARSDIYSLGCTLWYLIAGKVMYHGETSMEKLLKHREEPVPSLVAHTAGMKPAAQHAAPHKVSKKLDAVFQKMVAKEPKDRYQSMREVIQALEACGADYKSLAGLLRAASTAKPPAPAPDTLTVEQTEAGEAPVPRRAGSVSARSNRLKWIAAALAAAAITLYFAVFRVETESGTFIIETEDENVAVSLNNMGGVTLHDQKTGRKLHLKPGKHDVPTGTWEIEVADPAAGLVFNTRTFTMKRGEQVVVKARFEKAVVKLPRDVPVKLPPAVDQRIKAIQKLKPDDQVKEVAKWLVELNPGFDGKVTPQVAQGAVTELEFSTDLVSDLSPVRALTQLRQLRCSGAAQGKGMLQDLSPLRGLQLRVLTCLRNPVADLTPLAGMPIDQLHVADTEIHDLTPLQGMPLRKLGLSGTKVTDLSPLRGMSLGDLNFNWTKVKDLASVQGLPLTKLGFQGTPVCDLTPLRWLPLQDVNGEPVIAFWKKHDPAHAAFLQWIEDTRKLEPLRQVEAVRWKLQERNPGYAGRPEYKIDKGMVTELRFSSEVITDLAPVRALAGLEYLVATGPEGGKGKLADLSPLRDMALGRLDIARTEVQDLSPLAGMKLKRLAIYSTRVSDLSPLRDLPLEYLSCAGVTPITDLSPLRNCPLKEIRCNFKPERDAAILKSIKTFETINGKPAGDFWNEVDVKTTVTAERIQVIQKLQPNDQVKLVAQWLQELNPGYQGAVQPFIKDNAVTGLTLADPKLVDITPLRVLSRLVSLNIRGTGVADLTPLQDLPLAFLDCRQTPVTDLTPLRKLPLKYYQGDVKPGRDADVLRAIPTLERINDLPKAEFWKQFAKP